MPKLESCEGKMPLPVVIVKCQYAEDWDRRIKIDESDWGEYTVQYDIITEDDDHIGHHVLLAARRNVLSPSTGKEDPLPLHMDHLKFMGADVNKGVFAQEFDCWLPDPLAPTHWKASVTYKRLGGPNGGGPKEFQRKTEPNPLLWPVTHRIEWVEEQVPIEEAICLTDLNNIARGPSFGSNPPGPIVNACGNQTIDPRMKTVWHPILVATKNYPSLLNAAELNAAFHDTMNGNGDSVYDPSGDLFLGDDPGTWRFLYAASEDSKQVWDYTLNSGAGGIITYYPTTIKIEFRGRTWDDFVLNNGMVCFKTNEGVTEPVGGWDDTTQVQKWPNPHPDYPHLSNTIKEFPCRVLETSESDNPAWVDASEPCNLHLSGIQIHDKTENAKHIRYRYLTFANFLTLGSGIGGAYAEPLFADIDV